MGRTTHSVGNHCASRCSAGVLAGGFWQRLAAKCAIISDAPYSFVVTIAALITATAACSKKADEAAPFATPANRQVYTVKGVVTAVLPQQKQVEIKHEAVPGFMPAMTMPFDVKDTNELAGLEPGQAVSFRLTVTDTEGWIDQIQKLGPPSTEAVPAPPAPTRSEEH